MFEDPTLHRLLVPNDITRLFGCNNQLRAAQTTRMKAFASCLRLEIGL